ncbi:ribosome biogenesis GTP-binding protein YihA/YsxC [Candidatus Arthromitus sp. SFB-rat-Yit]|uniref:ribosome biogenesis GTP-binding protein YihA/YsxC n=1 Tax=Candidatus Arthromitus sp. SFB-rat-Yit TaxID=1041504 RepID=UPI000227A270|nr:ribosome biogenesis GTP-binding protein YihA/YsxC [Candidatus Arthromitus sp. SFB-rat-Yit]BAK80799.1 ribosome biogenesis GTP-binding protein YsxC [Candidatus Arthromitus sp. SFB-rat-Yit]
MFIYDSKFIKSVVKSEDFPNDGLKEIAIVGRSNVGKSSLINSMLQRKRLAKVSSTPGKTRTLNFFLINNLFYLVDLPGYGYAKLSKSERNSWKYMVESYFDNRACIDKVILLIDSRHAPFESDIVMYDWINSLKYKLDIIATKSDKLSYSQIKKNEQVFKKQFSRSNILFYSSLKNYNRNELLNFVFS